MHAFEARLGHLNMSAFPV